MTADVAAAAGGRAAVEAVIVAAEDAADPGAKAFNMDAKGWRKPSLFYCGTSKSFAAETGLYNVQCLSM